MPIKAEGKPIVYIVSDSIGDTAEFVVNAVASQFDSGRVELRRESFLTDVERLKEVIKEAAGNKSMIAYTLVLPHLRNLIVSEAQKYDLPIVDVMWPMLRFFQNNIGGSPAGTGADPPHGRGLFPPDCRRRICRKT